MEILSADEWLKRVARFNERRTYRAMYSSLVGGVVTDPALMMVPIDDHLVHRGDGVFEAIKFTPKHIYLLKPHLERLYRSADGIGLKIPVPLAEFAALCEELRQVAALDVGLLRLFVGRGPGDFSPNPYTTLGAQIYIMAVDFKPPPAAQYENGVSLLVSQVPVKPSPYAQIKSCNYLPNVMMKKDSVDRGGDYAVNLTDDGCVAEGPTENVALVSRDGELLAPSFDYTLRGTTLVRAMELAGQLKNSGLLKDVRVTNLHLADFQAAKEIMMIGTTLAVLPVTKFEGRVVSGGKCGPVARELGRLVLQDMGG